VSVEIPKMAVVFGSVTPPQGDVIECRVHLGCTKEVGSFECLLQNWDKKYSPSGTSPINVGMDGHIDIGRGSNVPQIITCRVESVKCESSPTENYIRVSGRCWGEKLFRRVVTKVYENKKGEAIVRDLIDYFVGLSHVRTNSALTADAASGQKVCAVSNGSLFTAGTLVKIEDNNAWEYNEVASVSGNTVTMVNNLANTYTVAASGKVWIGLIEKTDTTYTKLEYENTPVWDIIRYVAESSDKAGVIGYDFRVAPDGKFEFFQKNSKTSPVSLSEKIEVSEYRKDIHRIRNKIMIYGLADKSVPLDKDAWTEESQYHIRTKTDAQANAGQKVVSVQSVSGFVVGNKVLIISTVSSEENEVESVDTVNVDLIMKNNLANAYGAGALVVKLPGWFSFTGSGEVYLDTTFKAKGAASVKHNTAGSDYYGNACFYLGSAYAVNTNKYPVLSLLAYLEKVFSGNVGVRLYDTAGRSASKNMTIAPGEWRKNDIKAGLANETDWEYVQAGFDWSNIRSVDIACHFPNVGIGNFWIDGMYFGGARYIAIREDAASQSAYGLRELTETDEELVSDNECDLRAKSLLDYFKNPAEYLTVRSTVIDYGTTPLLAGDKIHVTLPNENVDSDFRIESVEYRVDAKTQTLEIALELGKVPPLLADYLYGLRATTVTVEKLARTKLGKKGLPSPSLGGGIGSHHVGHEAGGEDGTQWPSQNDGGWDKITGWVCPKHIGPFNDSAAIMNFRTKNKAGTAVLDHQLQPSDNEHGVLGCETAHWKEVHTLYLLLYTDGYMQIKTVGEANPKVRLSANMLQFGAGGASALDTWLKRIAANQFESSGDIIPDGDNVRSLGLGGATPKRWKEIQVVNLNISSHFIPSVDNTYDIGEGTTPKRWRDLYLAGAIKALAGGVAVHLLPNANATYDLGSSAMKWSNLYVSGVGDLGWLNVGGFTVITNARVLQNVTAAAGIITSGRFPLARLPEGDSGKFLRAYGVGFDPMYALLAVADIPSLPASKITSERFPLARFPEGTAGYVLEAEGAGFDPMYVNPNGRYAPAAHSHSHASLTGIGPNDHHAQVHNHAGEALSPDSIAVNTLSVAVSVNCKNWVHADVLFNNEFRITEAENVNLGHGLVFLNPKGKVIMLLDEDGNIEIFGKLKQQCSRLKSLWRKMKQNAKKVIKP